MSPAGQHLSPLAQGSELRLGQRRDWFLYAVPSCHSQALLHQYFFTAPLPAHPSELPIPQRPGGLAPKAHPGPSNVHDFHVDRPLEELLLNPELIRPFIPES